MKTILVTLKHTRALKYCTKGVRAWCRLRGIDFDKLSGDGIPADELEATNDHMAIEAARVARQEVEEE